MLTLLVACGGGDDGNPDGNKMDAGPSDTPSCTETPNPGPAPLRRLTRVEYNNTVFQLFGDTDNPGDAFVPDGESLGFTNQSVALSTSSLLVQQWMAASETISEKYVDKLLKPAPHCSGTISEAECTTEVKKIITSFGQRAFRRPLTNDEAKVQAKLFADAAAIEGDFDPREGMRAVIEATLQSPHFLYRVEFGRPAPVAEGVVELTSWEVATRLSYLMWNTMPDVALFEAAEADELRTPAQIAAQAERMVVAPRARQAVRNFHRQWLDIENIQDIASSGKNEEIYPEYDPKILPLLAQETEQFLDHAIFEENASVETLFTAPYTMMNRELAEWYGIENGPEGDEWEVVQLDPTKYSGFLTQAGLLMLHSKTDRSSPIHRGIYVRKRLLCQNPPAPPDNVPPPPAVDRSKTTREQFEQHRADDACNGCHQNFDPIGFGFEHFDGLGRYREQEWGADIDATGEILNTEDANGTYSGVVELGRKLSDSQEVRNCVATQWFRFSYGRSETDDDACSVEMVRSDFAKSKYDIKALLVALTKTPAFRYRRTVVPGGE